MKNKWFVSLLMVVVMMCACWTGAGADEERKTFKSGDYQYALLDDGTVEITNYSGYAKKLTIPNMLNGKKVTSIGDDAFFICTFLLSVTIPNSVTSIGDSAFYGCGSLTSVTIPDSVTSIGDSAFSACDSLTSVTIPDSVAQIGMNPFLSCDVLKRISVSPDHPYLAVIDDVLFRKADKTLICYPVGKNSSTYTIPKGITSIGGGAFFGCGSLTSVTIPDSVTSIGDNAFYSCSSLMNVIIPDSVVQIGVNPFAACDALKSFSISPDHPYFSVTDGVLFRKADKTLISYPAGKNSSAYTIPQGISAIGDGAFYGCRSLTSVTIPDSVTSIGDSAFSCCSSLTSVTIPDSVTTIGDDALFLCSSLTSVIIPDSVTSIGVRAFSLCSNLTLTVSSNSYALEYAKTNNIPYTYPDANDWLNN
mgnify:FL=1